MLYATSENNIPLTNGIFGVLRNVSLLPTLKTPIKINDERTKRRKRSQSASGTKQHRLIWQFLGHVHSKWPPYNDPSHGLREEFNSWQTTRQTSPSPFFLRSWRRRLSTHLKLFSYTPGGRLAFKVQNDKWATPNRNEPLYYACFTRSRISCC